jgi:hypothetical protein
VGSRHTEESMSNLEILIGHHLKHHNVWSFVTFIHALVCNWRVLPCPMHTINAFKHFSKSFMYILCQDPRFVFYIRCV